MDIKNKFLKHIVDKKFLVLFAFAFPIFCLIMATFLNEYQIRSGQSITLPIQGYDPRDLLSGHYLQYKILYGQVCPQKNNVTQTYKPSSRLKNMFNTKQHSWLCLKPKKQIYNFKPALNKCSLFIKGWCFGEFFGGGDRFYIPSAKAKQIERLFQTGKSKEVLLSVTKKGRIFAKDILVDKKSIKQSVKH